MEMVGTIEDDLNKNKSKNNKSFVGLLLLQASLFALMIYGIVKLILWIVN